MAKNSKLKSIKFIVTIWAMGLLTYIIIADKVDFSQLGMVLSGAPMAYCYCNVKQKEIFENRR